MENKLPKVFKRKWLAALRSGKYKQGKLNLYDKKYDVYCCLGVACDIVGYHEYLARHGGRGNIARQRIKVPQILHGQEEGSISEKLIYMNDGSWSYKKSKTFKQIANWIENNL